MLRAIESNRELLEVMTDFWSNHFNVYIAKGGIAPYYIATYERDTIRPHALGKFEDLLIATAKSPAMLNYLDNAQSIGPDSLAAQRRERFSGKKVGLNENYARELMELHTVGVNGSYTQRDVTEVARVFTGWTTGEPRSGLGAFQFDERRHEPGDKMVMGKTHPSGWRKRRARGAAHAREQSADGGEIFRIAPERPPKSVDPQTALIAGLLFGSPDFQRF